VIKIKFDSFTSINNFIKEIKSKFPVIDIIIDSSLFLADIFQLSEDDIERSIKINNIGPMCFISQLLENETTNFGRIIVVNQNYMNDSNFRKSLL
jgi:hypothetical protein